MADKPVTAEHAGEDRLAQAVAAFLWRRRRPIPPRGRWYQYRLRTLLIVVALSALAMPWGVEFLRQWNTANPLLPSNPRVTKVNSDAIHNGMTVAVVEQILGDPTGFETGGEVNFNGVPLKADHYIWINDISQIDVLFSEGRVVQKLNSGL